MSLTKSDRDGIIEGLSSLFPELLDVFNENGMDLETALEDEEVEYFLEENSDIRRCIELLLELKEIIE